MHRRESAFRRSVTLTVIALATVFAMTATADAARVAPCNGSSELCDRPFDEVTLPGSHNSMSNSEQGWSMPNQTFTIPHQLERGARAMLIDAHYGRPVTVAGKPAVADVAPADYDPAAGHRLYLCHSLCGMGASDLVEVLGQVRVFLEANPREVLLFVVEDGVTPEDFESAVQESGLDEFVYRGPTTEADGWPTLGSMIRENQRVVFLHESNRPSASWYPYAYGGTMQETPYTWPRSNNPDGYTGVQFLTEPAALPSSCVANRGGSSGPLFLMNHWVSGDGIPGSSDNLVPRPELAEVVNTRAALVARARACEEVRGLMPTILAVDFFGTGDVVGAARELNGVQAAPYLEIAKRPKRARVRAGKAAVYRLSLRNLGDAAGRPRVCATPPKRLAKKRCVKTVLGTGKTRVIKLRLKTRGRAKGKGKVRFAVTGAGHRLTAKAPLKVKPKRKPKRRKRR